MVSGISGPVHGSFAFTFNPEYTLWNSSGSWNLACARILEMLIDREYTEKLNSRRCMIIDIRNWSFPTPDCSNLVRDIIHRVATFYTSFNAAYVVKPKLHSLSDYLVRHIMDKAPESLHIHTFVSVSEAVSWLRSDGFNLPDLTDDDFPEPVYAEKYLEGLS